MARKKYTAEQIMTILRRIEVEQSKGKKIELICQQESIHLQTYYRWRKEYGGLKISQAKKLKSLEKENQRLKKLVADLSLDNAMLKDVASGNF